MIMMPRMISSGFRQHFRFWILFAAFSYNVGAGPVFVPNYSFEAPLVPAGSLISTNIPGWIFSGSGSNSISHPIYNSEIEGSQIANITVVNGSAGSVSGALDSGAPLVIIAPNTIYTLTVAVRVSGQGTGSIKFLSGSNVVASTVITSNNGSFIDQSIVFQTQPVGDPLVAQPLSIELAAVSTIPFGSVSADFDNVRLSASLARPQLSFQQPAPGQIRLHWPIYYTNFFVERTPALAQATWQAITNVSSQGVEWTLDLPADMVSGFFRLHGPERNPPDHFLSVPPLGLNTYYNVGINANEALVRHWIDIAYDYGLADLGWRYIVIDDGWQGGRTNGILLPNPNNFPDITNLVNYAHDHGLRIGIYTEPSVVTSDGLPGSAGYLEQDAATFAAWGIDYVKFDVITPQDNQAKLDQAIEFTTAFRAAAAPRPVVVMSSGYRDFITNFNPLALSAALDMWRPVGDLGSFIPSGYNNLWTNYVDVWLGNAERYSYAVGPGHWMDLDHIILDETNTTRGTFAMSAMLCVPMITAVWATPTETPFRFQTMTNQSIIRIHQDSLGIPARRVLSNDLASVWVKKLDNGDRAVALLNHTTNIAVNVRFDWTNAGFASNQMLKVYDCWKSAVATNGYGSFSSVVPGMSANIFILSPVQLP
jgi:alpha-galactosidase